MTDSDTIPSQTPMTVSNDKFQIPKKVAVVRKPGSRKQPASDRITSIPKGQKRGPIFLDQRQGKSSEEYIRVIYSMVSSRMNYRHSSCV